MAKKQMFDTNLYNYASIEYPEIEGLINDNYAEELDIIIMPQIVEAELLSIPRNAKDAVYKAIIEGYINPIKRQNNIIPLNEDIINLAADVRIQWQIESGKRLPLPDAIIALLLL